MKDPKEGLKQRIGAWLDKAPERIFLYWKGRVALYSILRAYGIEKGDEVIMPAFTCVVVPNAVLYAGGEPVYVDVDPESLNAPYEAIEKAVNERTRVIIAQNSFGLSTDLDRIAALGKEKGILTIEDCTHGFGGTFQGSPNGTWCDASFFSSQWNKPFSTGLGGFSFVGNDALLEEVRKMDQDLQEPGRKEKFLLKASLMARKHLLRSWNYYPLLRLYRAMSQKGLIVGSSSGQELQEVRMPEDFFKGMSRMQARAGVKALKDLDKVLERRKANGRAYSEVLEDLGKWHVAERYFPDHSFLTYPILLKDRDAFKKAAEKAHIPLGDWFASPLHPVEGDLSLWGMKRDDFPVADRVSRKILNLPTDPKDPERVIAFLREHQELIADEL